MDYTNINLPSLEEAMKLNNDIVASLNTKFMHLYNITFTEMIESLYCDSLFTDISGKRLYHHYDHIGKQLFNKKKFYENRMLDYIKELNKGKKPNVLDVGANIGNHSVYFSTFADKVFAYEPCESNFSKLEKNVRYNNIENITISQKGLSTKSGTYYNLEVLHNRGMNTLVEDSKGDILTVNGDQEVIGLNVEIDVIKIDCENMSYDVLKSLTQTIDKFKPDIFIEGDEEILTYVKKRGWGLIKVFNSTPTYHIKTT
jgi:protein O-GlcNAc transferase